jgi:hypothetical protein
MLSCISIKGAKACLSKLKFERIGLKQFLSLFAQYYRVHNFSPYTRTRQSKFQCLQPFSLQARMSKLRQWRYIPQIGNPFVDRLAFLLRKTYGAIIPESRERFGYIGIPRRRFSTS